MGEADGRRGAMSALALVLGSGPRFARDAFGPVLVFYLGLKVAGFRTGIVAATVMAVAAFLWERGQARSGLTAAIGLGVAFAQGLTGLVSGRPFGYFAPPLIVNGACGLAFLVSAAIGQPLAGIFAAETYAFPARVRTSLTFRRVCSRISLAWAAYLLLGSAIRLAVLVQSPVDLYVFVNVLTGFPVTAALMSWSVWYGLRSLRRLEPWALL